MAVTGSYDVQVEVDGGQFYACRAEAEWASDRVTTKGYEQYLWTNGSFVYIGTTKRYGPTPVRVEVLDHEPPIGDESWQHVAEVSLHRGGALEIFDWEVGDPCVVVDVEDRPLRLRVSWRGLVPDLAEGLDENGESSEELLMQTWPGENAPDSVLRCWEERYLPEPTDTSPQGLRQVEGYEDMLPMLARLELRGRLAHPYPSMPGGAAHSSVVSVHHDRADGSWWVDGYDVRRTLREVTEDEAAQLLAAPPQRRGEVSGTPLPTSLLDFFTLHRHTHPIDGEVVRLTLVGWPEGRTVRFAQRFIACFTVGVCVSAFLQLFADVSVALALPIGVAAAVLIVLVWAGVRRSMGRPSDRQVGLLITSARVVIARAARPEPDLVLTTTPDAIRWARISTAESTWLHNTPITRVELGGEQGEVIDLEMLRVREDALRVILEEADIAIVAA